MRSYLDFENRAELEAGSSCVRSRPARRGCHRREIARLEAKAAQALSHGPRRAHPGRRPRSPAIPSADCSTTSQRGSPISSRSPGSQIRRGGRSSGLGRFRGESTCIIGHEKGLDREPTTHFGMAARGLPQGGAQNDHGRPLRIRAVAGHTAGAIPGSGRRSGPAEAIARSTDTRLELGVPNVAVIGRRRLSDDRHRQPRADAGARHLQPERGALDPVARHRQAQDARNRHESPRRTWSALG